MRNLLQLEESVLSSNTTLQNGFKIEEINQFQNEIFTSGVSKFQSSVKMSKIVKKSMEFFNSTQCKEQMQEEGISWTKEEFFYEIVRMEKGIWLQDVASGKHPHCKG